MSSTFQPISGQDLEKFCIAIVRTNGLKGAALILFHEEPKRAEIIAAIPPEMKLGKSLQEIGSGINDGDGMPLNNHGATVAL